MGREKRVSRALAGATTEAPVRVGCLMGGKLCKWSGGYDSDEDDEDHLKGLDGAGKIDDDDELDPSLIKNSNLPAVFAEVDEDGTGAIEYPEFLKGFGLDNTPLTQKLFYLFDEDHSGALDYYEFLKVIDRYRKMTYDERLNFCFKVYDLDDSGYIDRDELAAVIMDMNYAVRSYRNAKGMIAKLNSYYEIRFGERLERVDCDQFKALAGSHGTLLIYPCMGVMERILGTAFNDPDNHLDTFDCLRPGQAGVLLQKYKAQDQADAEL